MKAKRDNIVNSNRVNLADVIPLDTPFSLFIDVCNACNFKCKFCAIQTSEISTFRKQVMDWKVYKKVIDDLTEFSVPLKMLRLTANGEPLLNKELPRMIKYAKEKNVTEHIEIVTNGSLLTRELSDSLIEAGLNRIRISIEAIDEDGYEAMCGKKIDWKQFVSNIEYFYNHRKQCKIYIKTVDAAVKSDEEKRIFYKEFEGICDKISIEHVIPIWTDYKKIYSDFDIEKGEGLHGHAIKAVNICPFPFYSFVINPDGEVTVCCNDWKREISMGNVCDENVCDIWRGGKYREFLTGMIEKGRLNNHSTCATCEYPMFDAVDNLDDYREILLEKYVGEK